MVLVVVVCVCVWGGGGTHHFSKLGQTFPNDVFQGQPYEKVGGYSWTTSFPKSYSNISTWNISIHLKTSRTRTQIYSI